MFSTRSRTTGALTIGLLTVASFSIATTANAQLTITEILYNPLSTPDVSWEFVEVYNPTAMEIDLTGWILDDNDNPILTMSNIAGGSVPAGGTAVLFNDDGLDVADMVAAWETGLGLSESINWVPVTNWSGLSNGGEQIGLWSSLADYGTRDFMTSVDTVEYDDVFPWPFAGGTSNFASIELENTFLDNDNGFNWQLAVDSVGGAYTSNPAGLNGAQNVGSPGTVVIPEPATIALLGFGGLALIRRRK